MDVEADTFTEFADFRIDQKNKVLWHNSEPIAIPLKEMELLCLLVERAGEVVSKEDIFSSIWPESFVEESNITRHIYLLRRILRQAGTTKQSFIQTIPKRGYRFSGTIRKRADPGSPTSPENSSLFEAEGSVVHRRRVERQPPPAARTTGTKRLKFLIYATLAVVLIFGAVIWQLSSNAIQHKNSTIPSIRSLAVLPLRGLGEDNESLRLRITDSLISRLNGMGRFRVRPMSSVQKFLNDERDGEEIGRLLLVDAVIEGTLKQDGDEVKVVCSAIYVETGETLWTGHFDGLEGSLLTLQNSIATEIVAYFDSVIVSDRPLVISRKPTENPEAYESYLHGRFFLQKRTHDDLLKAIAHFEKAIRLDPVFVDAYTRLAESHFLIFEYIYDPTSEHVRTAKQYIQEALRLDPDNVLAYVTLGAIQTSYERDWIAAEASLRAALRIDPESTDANHRLALLMLRLRRFGEAEAAIKDAKANDPTSLAINMNLGLVLFSARRQTEAVEQLVSTIELDPTFAPPYWYLARAYWEMGDTKNSFLTYAKALRLIGHADLASRIERDSGIKSEGQILSYWIDDWAKRKADSYSLAILAAQQGDREATLLLIGKALRERNPWATKIGAEPEFEFLAGEKRFQAMLDELRLR